MKRCLIGSDGHAQRLSMDDWKVDVRPSEHGALTRNRSVWTLEAVDGEAVDARLGVIYDGAFLPLEVCHWWRRADV